MKKWTINKIKAELLSGGIPKNEIFICTHHFENILEIVKNRNFISQVDIKKIIEQAIACNEIRVKKSQPHWQTYSTELYLRGVANDLDKGFILPDFQFPKIPGKQKEFTIAEVMLYARVSRSKVEYDIEYGNLEAEKVGNKYRILRKNLLKYIKYIKEK